MCEIVRALNSAGIINIRDTDNGFKCPNDICAVNGQSFNQKYAWTIMILP